jgi:hypothetical protein
MYGWGNYKSFRLTKEYGKAQLKIPKYLNISVQNTSVTNKNQNENNNNNNNNSGGKNEAIDERQILAILSNNPKKMDYKEICTIIKNLSSKYDYKELKSLDKELEKKLSEGIRKIGLNCDSLNADKYINLDKLLTTRFKQVKVPKYEEKKKDIPDKILNNIDQIENIYTLFYLHPCYLRDYFREYNEKTKVNSSNFYLFLNGLKPLFNDLLIYSQKCESLSNITFLSMYKIVIHYEIEHHQEKIKNIDNLYIKELSFAEQMIECYFYNSFGKSILLDIFENTLKEVKAYCVYIIKNYIKNGNFPAAINRVKEIFKDIQNIFVDPTYLSKKHVKF